MRSSTLKPTPQLREKLRKEFDPERNELFFARHVILVEGDTEKLALPEYARRSNLNLNRAGCSIIEVGGKRGLRSFADILLSFGIPVTIVFDTDSSDFSDQDAEKAYNNELLALKSANVHVIELSPNYEAKLKTDLGASAYDQLAVKHGAGGPSKAIRARLIAADDTSDIPAFALDILATVEP